MANSRSREPYNFDFHTKHERLSTVKNCEICGKPPTRDDPFEADHIVAIWFAIENPCLAAEVIKSVANMRIVHRSCHRDLHLNESRRTYTEMAPIVLQRYLDMIVNHRLDDWRDKLKQYQLGYAGDD